MASMRMVRRLLLLLLPWLHSPGTAGFKLHDPLASLDLPDALSTVHEALAVHGDWSRARRHLERSMRGEGTFTVVAIGGSATAGAGEGCEKHGVAPAPPGFASWMPQAFAADAVHSRTNSRHHERLCTWSARLVAYLAPLVGSSDRLLVVNAAVGRGTWQPSAAGSSMQPFGATSVGAGEPDNRK